MEHGWCPTNSPGRTPFRIAGRFAVLLDFPGFLILDQPPKRYGTWLVSDQLPWSDILEPTTKVLRPAHLVGHPSLRSRQGNPGSEYQARVVRGRHSITADQWRQLNQTASSADSPPAASIWKKSIACGRSGSKLSSSLP